MSGVACVPYSSVGEAESALGPAPDGLTYYPWLTLHMPQPPLNDVAFFAPPNTPGLGHVWMPWVPQMPRLDVLQLASAGYDNALDLARPGLKICNAAGVHDAATAEAAVTLTLALLRDLPSFAAAQAAHQWSHHRAPGLAGKTVLIFGYGRIGAAIERRLVGFEPARIIRIARRAKSQPVVHPTAELSTWLPQADVVIVQAPATSQTKGLFDADTLGLMKPGAALINTGRGAVVDTMALVDALHAGRLSAGLDVVVPEPLPPDHPLWDAPNVVILPHVGSTTDIEFVRHAALVAEQLRRYAAGEPMEYVVA